MGNKIDAIEAFRQRLVDATAAGKPLADVKRVRVGSSEEARQQSDFPIINIDPVSGDEQDYYSQNGKTDKMILELRLIATQLDDDTVDNSLYKITTVQNVTTVSGPLYLFEQLLNVLDKNGSGTVDRAAGLALNRQARYVYEIITDPTYVTFVLKLEIETAQFQAGSR